MRKRMLGAAASAATFAAVVCAAPPPTDYRARLPQDELMYFVLPDRFANGDPANDHGGPARGKLVDGFDPGDKAFYHGGDLKGLAARLDYIQGLGVTAIWLGPIFRNKAVQGLPGHESAGYHGYWITDFLDVDPHLGTRADLKALVDAAHRRGLKVYLDIVANHTADVIQYRECKPDGPCPYRSRADYPYTRRGGVGGQTINGGFEGDDAAHQTAENFAKLTDPNYAYTPYLPAGEEHVKNPPWLNDPLYYHNRGNSRFVAEDSQLGDFGGLDDVFTENPRVVRGFIEIYGKWIDDFGIDGYRIDTARHVDPEFWQAFVPAMLARARAKGIPHFHIFGEVFDPDPGVLASHTRMDKLPAVLDFAFQSAVAGIMKGAGTDSLHHLFEADADYEGGAAGAMQLPTFLGNHDMGRIGFFLRTAMKGADDATLLKADELAHALLLFSRGAPVIYAGDEQGFAGHGGDQDARQDMFASRVASYNDEPLIGSPGRTTASDSYVTSAPLYRAIAEMARVRAADPALRRGRQVARAWDDKPGLWAFSRLMPGGRETLVAINTGREPVDANVSVEYASRNWQSEVGACAPHAAAPGSYHVTVPALGYLVCTTGPVGAPH